MKRARSGIVAAKFHNCLSWASRFGRDIISFATRQSSLLSDLENTPRVNTSSADGFVFPAMILALDGLMRDEQTLTSTNGSAFGGSRRPGYCSDKRPWYAAPDREDSEPPVTDTCEEFSDGVEGSACLEASVDLF